MKCSVIDEFYDQWNRPANFTTNQFLSEIILSYHLLFADDRGARSAYRSLRKSARDFAGIVDPLLDKHCGMHHKSSTQSRNSYNKVTDFPILSKRLLIIQDDISRQQINGLKLLVLDRRDILRRWTFLAVLIFGAIGILLGALQLVASIVQTVYTVQGG